MIFIQTYILRGTYILGVRPCRWMEPLWVKGLGITVGPSSHWMGRHLDQLVRLVCSLGRFRHRMSRFLFVIVIIVIIHIPYLGETTPSNNTNTK